MKRLKRMALQLGVVAVLALILQAWTDPSLMHRLTDAVRACF